jgi:hypothetical protein
MVLVDICRPAQHVSTLITKVVQGAAVVTPIVPVFIPIIIVVTAAREHLVVQHIFVIKETDATWLLRARARAMTLWKTSALGA